LSRFRGVAALVAAATTLAIAPCGHAVAVSPRLVLSDPSANDQDDLCIWIAPDDPARSTLITSDKFADLIFVYDLQGNRLQSIPTSGTPGNIDLVTGFPYQGEWIDIAVLNNRTKNRLMVYGVDPELRTLTRIDANDLACADNYGLCLYRSRFDGTTYVFTTSQLGEIHQYALFDAGAGLAVQEVRAWSFGSITEGCVADPKFGVVYFAQETVGIWKVRAEPDEEPPGVLIARVGENGLAADVEGLTLCPGPGREGYLIASSQGNSTFKAYERTPPHSFVTTVTVLGVTETDGIDVTARSLGPAFPLGLFACHDNSASPKSINVCALEELGLPAIDTWESELPPPPSVTDAPALPAAGAPTLRSAPNPFRGRTRLRISLARPGTVSLWVTDAAGRSVARLLPGGAVGAGTHFLDWNGTDDTGRALPAGVYFYRLESEGGAATGKTTLLR
jgi:3-phytase